MFPAWTGWCRAFDMDTAQRAAFLASAESMIGTPFLHQGRLPGVGLDCAGLVVCALRQAGIDVEDVAGYGRLPRHGLFQRMVEAQAARVPVTDLQDADLLMFRWRTEPQHLAIHVGGQIIHGWQDAGRVVRHDLDATWRARLVGAYRVGA